MLVKDHLDNKKVFVKEHDDILNAILDSADNAIVAINKNNEIIVYNNFAEKILGAKVEASLGRGIYQVLPNSRLPEVIKNGKAELEKIEVFNDRQLMIHRTPIIKEKEIIGAVAVFQDITDLKRVTQELEMEKHISEILKTILDNAYDGIVVVDENGVVTMMNNAYADYLGVKKEDVVGKHVTEVIESSRLHIVAKTGIEEIGEIQKIKGKNIVVMRIPIIKAGKVVGVIGKIMFKDLKEVGILANKINTIEKELKYYKDALRQASGVKYNFDSIVGSSEKIQEAKYLGEKAAHTNSNVLIRGESGTGKELFAHAIHGRSNRAMGPFVKVNCAAIPAELLESELFGYEEGAFTGAKRGGKKGKFELANGGSIFLDEIGDMPHSMQAKLLRVLQEKEIERVGGIENIPLNVRIIAATNRNLEEMVEKGEFREDLYYRLNVMTITIPPLRERSEDLELLIQHLMTKICEQVGNYVTGISSQAMKQLKSHGWPGNVRELENVLERAANLVDYGKEIQINHLPIYLKKSEASIHSGGKRELKDILEEAEKDAIIDCLKNTGGNRTETARILNISRSSLYEKIWKYGI
ncbi:PAS domain S-box-containing protein [Anaerosolibacter carboniphilus]|uniref:PAS domain S-box-containing protein n=1 Tax=Anaerosolibacter carboniphilus TaxID=1417629 RepID=A0A841KL28_9FIRM|nr:sigma-54-dependent Fis family transcriptional regulator [Anaerosolibacter carboniphilus]MBB6214046.1 PAS domain S-box-containing protein [Anaerosolibacter carboniphilus]